MYSYEYLTKLKTENNWTAAQFENEINKRLASGQTFPVAIDKNGKVLMNSDGTPKHMVFDYTTRNYEFKGGDAIYEDVNNDGQINQLDVVYLGNSLPKVNGGFGLNLTYGQFKLTANFNYRFGNKVVNTARMELEKMSSTYNQCASVNYRWRKDGDGETETVLPRAIYGDVSAFNWMGSDRYVENGSFVRFQYLQLTYTVPKKLLKKLGLNTLKIYGSANNLYCWTKYSGTDPEHSASGWGFAEDTAKTPRTKSFTLSLNLGF